MNARIEKARSETGIDEAMIARVVHTFYGRVRKDPLIGPVFEQRIQDWDRHLARMCMFWSSVTLKTGRYQGQPMAMHLPLPVDGRHFDRWLDLFGATVTTICPPAAARAFLEVAGRIALSMELGIAGRHGVMLFQGERLRRPDAEVWTPEREDAG